MSVSSSVHEKEVLEYDQHLTLYRSQEKMEGGSGGEPSSRRGAGLSQITLIPNLLMQRRMGEELGMSTRVGGGIFAAFAKDDEGTWGRRAVLECCNRVL